MAISFNCAHCGKTLKTTDDKAGLRAKCPGCGEIVVVPAAELLGAADVFVEEEDPLADEQPPPARVRRASSGAETAARTCPMCGAQNPRRARSCGACGEPFETLEEREPRRRGFEYAGFWLRFGAFVIDQVILGCVGLMVGGGIGIVLAVAIIAANNGDANALEGPGMDAFFNLLGNGIGLVINWLYHALMESSSKRATLGKMAVGIEVCDLDGRRISFGRASGRFFAKILSGMICLIGYIMAGFTEQKQALHDQLAGTLVVRA